MISIVKQKLTVVTLVAALGAMPLMYFWVLPDFFSARIEPGLLETKIVRWLRHLAIPRAMRDKQNPIGLSQEVLAEARGHFADHCASCHGKDGRGQTEMGERLFPRVPDMTSRGIQSLSDGELYYAIHNGVRFSGMPAWDPEGDGDWSHWKVIHFIRHLPRITEQELKEMSPKGSQPMEEHNANPGSESNSPSHKH